MESPCVNNSHLPPPFLRYGVLLVQFSLSTGRVPLFNALIRGEPKFRIAKYGLKKPATSFYRMMWSYDDSISWTVQAWLKSMTAVKRSICYQNVCPSVRQHNSRGYVFGYFLPHNAVKRGISNRKHIHISCVVQHPHQPLQLQACVNWIIVHKWELAVSQDTVFIGVVRWCCTVIRCYCWQCDRWAVSLRQLAVRQRRQQRQRRPPSETSPETFDTLAVFLLLVGISTVRQIQSVEWSMDPVLINWSDMTRTHFPHKTSR